MCVDLLKQDQRGGFLHWFDGIKFSHCSLRATYYQSLERDKIHALRERKRDWGKPMALSDKERGEITWWVENV